MQPSPTVSRPVPLNTQDPDIRATIIDEYESYGSRYIKSRYDVDPRTVRRWRAFEASRGSLKPLPHRGGHPFALTPHRQRDLEQELIRDPYATDKQLAQAVGNSISRRTAGRYVKRSTRRFTSKMESLDVEKTFSREHAEDGLVFGRRVKRIPLKNRVYVDETWTSAGLRRRKVKTPRGQRHWRRQNRKYPRYTIISALTLDGLLHPSRFYKKGSITTKEFEHYVKYHLAPLLRPGQVVFWDRLGKSGRALKPVAHHWSPKARRLIEACGAKLEMLPANGKLFDPVEIFFGATKQAVDERLRKKIKDANPSNMPFLKLKRNWRHVERRVPKATIKHAFKRRANGQEFIEVCKQKGLLD